MIPLQLKIDPFPIDEPIVVRLRASNRDQLPEGDARDAWLVARGNGTADFDLYGCSLRVHTPDPEALDGDVVFINPGRSVLHRLVRASSQHNTLLVTEQCDQKCIMCSQPPKDYHVDMFGYFLEAVEMAPMGAIIGLSGGEPLLHKRALLDFLAATQERRPDIRFHVLTNGQHFDRGDAGQMSELNLGTILWGIPIYSARSAEHDRIVAKTGAFGTLQKSLAMLGELGATIELRTVVLQSNAGDLEELAAHITRHHSYAESWAIMQLENIGFGRMNWNKEFNDTSRDFSDVAAAIDLASGRGTNVVLFNFPLCTVPAPYRRFCAASISDWKQKFLSTCEGCSLRSTCTGFFDWYPEERGFSRIAVQ